MQNQLLKIPNAQSQFIIICGIGLMLGIASVLIPANFLLIGIAGMIYIVIASLWPEIALLGIIFFTSTIFDISTFPSIPIGFGHLVISDILLFVLFAIILIRGFIKSNKYYIRTPLDFPLLGFYLTALVATAFGIYYSRISFNQSLGELRVINYFLIFFIVTNLVRNEKQLRRLYNGIMVLAIFVSLAMIAQYTLGSAVTILPGRVEVLNTAGTDSYGITRVLPPGQSLVMVVFVSLFVQMLFDKSTSRTVTYLVQLGIVGLAVLLTFNRSFWVAIYIALVLVGIMISFRDKLKFMSVVFGLILLGAIILTQFSAKTGSAFDKFYNGMIVRLATLVNPETTQENSMLYRNIENEYALTQIESHPIIGLGLGASYRPVDYRINSTETSYIHNGHLWVMLKTGLLGYIFFMGFLLLYIKRGFEYWKQIPDPFHNGILLSFVAIFVGLLFALLVNPIIVDSYWNPILGIMLGMGEVIIIMNSNQSIEYQN